MQLREDMLIDFSQEMSVLLLVAAAQRERFNPDFK